MDTTRIFHENIKAYVEGKTLIINQGGTSSSKSYSILELLIIIAHKRKVLISVVSESLPHLRRGVMRDFFNILKEDDLYIKENHNMTANSYKFNEGTIEFFSVDQPERVRGPRRDILFVNEINNIPQETFTQLEIRTSKATFVDFNPTAPFYVLDYPESAKTHWIISTYRDNKFLSPKIISSIEARKLTHPQWYATYGMGQWGELEESIFTNWKQIPEIPKDAKLLGFGVDFGFTNDPTAIVEVRMQDGELFIKELLYETELTNRDIIKKMEELGIVKGYDEVFADSAEPKSIKDLKDAGYLVRGATKGPDSLLKGIDLVKQYKINVCADSINLIRELRNYRWKKDKFTDKAINKPEDSWNHLMDALRYLCVMKLGKKRKFLRQWN